MSQASSADTPGELGFIGLGRMGKPMARNLLRAGYALTVNNRSQGPMDGLAALGARTAVSPSEVAGSSQIVLTCLPGPADVEAVLTAALAGAAPGTIFIDLSTIDPGTSRRIARVAEPFGVSYLDAPVSGGVSGAEAGTLTVMVGGERRAFERCRSILAAIGERIYHLGPVGSGNLAKLCNQLLAGVGYAAVGEALVLGAKGGLDPRVLYEVLSVSSGRSRVLEQAGPRILSRDYDAAFALDLAWKDLECAVAAGEEEGVPLRLAALAREIYAEARRLGLGGLDQAAVVTPLERMTGVKVGRP